MDWGLRLQRAFALEVEIGAPSIDGANYKFAIIAGSLETEPTFSPPLKINSISGVDDSILVGNKLRLNVSVDLHLQEDVGSKSAKKWHGTLFIGESEQSIIRGDFEGKTDFGNPLVTFQFDVDKEEDLVELEDRIFVGQGRFVKDKETEKLILVYQVCELQASELPSS